MRDVVVDREARQIWRRKLQDRSGDDRRQGEGGLAKVWAQVSQQPLHQPAVVGLSDDVVVVC